MRRLIDIARELKPGQRIRIGLWEQNIPRNERKSSGTLSDAQIIAYQNWTVLSAVCSEDSREVFCTILR